MQSISHYTSAPVCICCRFLHTVNVASDGGREREGERERERERGRERERERERGRERGRSRARYQYLVVSEINKGIK